MYLIRVLLADDHPVLRSGLRVLLDAEPGIRVVGEAGDGPASVRLANELVPDVAVVDLAMPQMDGAEVIRRSKAHRPALKVIGISAGGAMAADQMREAGADGFVAKEAAFEQLADAVRAVASGHEYFLPRNGRPSTDNSLTAESQPARLSPRERDVVQLMAEGLATKQIARQLAVSVKTVETHRRSLMEKLGLDSVAQVTKYAIRQGFTTVD